MCNLWCKVYSLRLFTVRRSVVEVFLKFVMCLRKLKLS